MNARGYDGYLVEVFRLFVIVIFLIVSGYFVNLLPFMSDLPFIKMDYSLSEFFEFLIFTAISFLGFEFSFRVEKEVNLIFDFIPQAGKIHRYIIFIFSIVLFYTGGINTFSKLIGRDYLWIYQMFFAGFVLFIIAKTFLIIYREGENFGRNIYNKMKGGLW